MPRGGAYVLDCATVATHVRALGATPTSLELRGKMRRLPPVLIVLSLSASAVTAAMSAETAPPSPPAQAADKPPLPAKADESGAQLVHGNSGQAIAAYTEALKDTGLANDRRASILNDRAVAYMRSGQTKLALEDFNRAVQLFAEYPAAYNNRGNLLVSIGQYAEAVKDFDRAVLLAPQYAAAYSNRANAHLRLGHQADAGRDFSKASNSRIESLVRPARSNSIARS